MSSFWANSLNFNTNSGVTGLNWPDESSNEWINMTHYINYKLLLLSVMSALKSSECTVDTHLQHGFI